MRKFLLVAVSLVILAGAGSATADTVLRFAHVNSPNSPAGKAAEYFQERVQLHTEGRVRVQLFPASQLGNNRQMFSSLRGGSIDLSLTPYPMLADIVPELSVYVAGYMFESFEEQQRILQHPELGASWADQLREKGGLRVLCSFYYGSRNLTTTNKPVRTRKDMQGLKIRAVPQPASMSVIRGLGATPTPVPLAEVFQGLRQGVIDGQENPLPVIYNQKFFEVQDYLMLTNHQLVPLPYVMNEAKWKSLGRDQQAVQRAADEACARGTELTVQQERELIETFKARGMNVITAQDGLDIEGFRASVREEVQKTFDGEIWPAGTWAKIQSALGR
ncbi:MAG TPA: TRAP transporter substrate-binding protein [Hyphomicrobiaceae bacterium]|jgi:tripartite ATP-independent transporter DctP family solute receptor